MAYKVRVGGSWVDVVQPKVRVGGAWTNCTNVYARVNGAWSKVWTAEADARPNSYTTDANITWQNTGNITDGSLGDTSTYGNPYGSPYNANVNAYGYIQFASQTYSSATLYLKYGWVSTYDSYTGDASTTLSIINASSGSTLSTIATKNISDASSTSVQSATFTLAANSNLNYLKVKVGVRKLYTTEPDYNNCLIYGPPDPDGNRACETYGTIAHASEIDFTIYDCYIHYAL